ncbi:hypothetical protein QS460_09090 [Liquorilactobacillus mali]|uniref:Beta-xylosidase n=1 Tax=Liquorilactobacillus mali TaxID=1618 RepID=A0A0R2FNS9_9LACO|nr:hypothetical protein [Liquorilactobacillus mali]KRN30223.1 hypothetical protein IV36_GL002262 [Liquorilactobacillus mali]MDN7146081.1 hypothetical protein [Liquorilactobacillus mali]
MFKKIGIGILIVISAICIYLSIAEKTTITVNFVDENGTKLLVKPKKYYGVPYTLLSSGQLEKKVPGYKPTKSFIFFHTKNQKITLKFTSRNYKKEIDSFNKAKYVAATFQPMTVTAKNGFQSDPYNTARTYNGNKTGKDSLRLIYSEDGINWKKLHVSYPRLNVRDPSIIKIDNYWYIVYTKGIVRTKDFKQWEKIKWPHSKIFVNHFEWAPEFFKDAKGKYHIIMAGKSTTTGNFHLYVSDFNQKTGRILNNWQGITGNNLPNNMIDGNLTYHNGKYVLFYKNEDVTTNKLTRATSDNYLGPYKSETLNVNLKGYDGAEGLEAIFSGNTTRLYVDTYKFNKKGQTIYNGIHYTKETGQGNTWTELKPIKAPFIVRHFGILKTK